jgi:3-oxoacyl-[acyl-carrier protein] reductase
MKVAIITGGTRGLGRELSLQLGEAGYYVVPIFREDSISAESLQNELNTKNIDHQIIKLDITQPESAMTLKKVSALKDADSICVIHNATSSFNPQAFHTLNIEGFDRHLRIVAGAIAITQTLMRDLLKTHDSTVVTVLSTALNEPGLPVKGFSGYVAGKYALLGLTKALASEYHDRGLRIFGVSPGPMQTDLTKEWQKHFGLKTEEPHIVAKKIMSLIADPNIPANGETYPV